MIENNWIAKWHTLPINKSSLIKNSNGKKSLPLTLLFFLIFKSWQQPLQLRDQDPKKNPGDKVADLDPADDREAGEEPHGAADEADLGLQLHLLVKLNVVEGGSGKEDLDQLKGWRV